MATLAELNAVNTQLQASAIAAAAALANKNAQNTSVGVSTQNRSDALAYALRAEAALAAIGSGGGGTPSSLVALIQYNQNADGVRTATWPNDVTNGPVFLNKGSAGVLGGRGATGGPLGADVNCCYADSASDGQSVTISQDPVSFTGTYTSELLFRALNPTQGTAIQLSTNGTGDGAVFVNVELLSQSATNKAAFRIRTKAFGFDESFDTQELDALTINGQSNCFHIAQQREADGRFSFRSQGNLLGTTTAAFTGTITGRLCPFGGYEQATDRASGIFRALLGFASVRNSAVYSGSTYTVPTARPVVS